MVEAAQPMNADSGNCSPRKFGDLQFGNFFNRKQWFPTLCYQTATPRSLHTQLYWGVVVQESLTYLRLETADIEGGGGDIT